MECNKDEADRAKSIAESKLDQKDYFGAKKFAQKAQTLYPGLNGISQMLTTLEVYLSAENKIGGEVDWYRVLDVNPTADDDAIKKQYKKLALLLHPDKNKSAGADGAFKLISEAWKLLQDKEKRLAFNQRRGCRSFASYTPAHHGAPSRPNPEKAPAYSGGAQSVPPRPSQQKVPAPARPKQPKRSAKVPKTRNPTPPVQRPDAFWAVCNGCNIYFEHFRKYCNQTLLCPVCQKPFLAREVAPPFSVNKWAKPVPWGEWKQRSSKKFAGPSNAYDPNGNGGAAGAGLTGESSFTVRYSSSAEIPTADDNLKRSDGIERYFKKVKLGDDSNRYGVNNYMGEGNGDFGGGIYGCS